MNKYKKIFEDAIVKKHNNVVIKGAYKTKERSLIIAAVNELIQRKDIQNIHHLGNNHFIIEYEET